MEVSRVELDSVKAEFMRPEKIDYYLCIAEVIADRSTCIRRKYGAVIVKNDEIISTGYNGAPRGRKNCSDLRICAREKMRIPQGERYELCRSVHAEANAIISAPRRDMIGATLYLFGKDAKTGKRLDVAEPCAMCKRLVINAGVERLVAYGIDGTVVSTDVREWIENDDTVCEWKFPCEVS